FLEESVDTGSVISRSKTAIGPNETTGDLYNRLKEAGAKLLLHSIDSIDRGEVNAVPQDHALATPAPKVYKKDGELDFSRSAEEVHNRIRAFNPVPGAWSVYDGKRLNIYRSHRLDGVAGEPGQLSISNGRLVVSCGSGSLEMIELQMAGGKRLSGVEFSNGFDSNRKLGGPLGNSG
ncbi:MAG: methionyl-tRNA formyltransferase, partial [Balneolaceae bacterium]